MAIRCAANQEAASRQGAARGPRAERAIEAGALPAHGVVTIAACAFDQRVGG
jgi:hypothetical protein